MKNLVRFLVPLLFTIIPVQADDDAQATGCTTGASDSCSFDCAGPGIAQLTVVSEGIGIAKGRIGCGLLGLGCEGLRSCTIAIPSSNDPGGSCELQAGTRATCGVATPFAVDG